MASEKLTAVFNAVETVSNSLEEINRSIAEQQRELYELTSAYAQASIGSEGAEQSMAGYGRAANTAARKTSELSREMQQYIPTASIASAANTSVGSTGKIAASGLDSVEDEAEDASKALLFYEAAANSAALSMGNLSVNVGAFNIGLRNLGTQIPTLVTGIGSLVSAAGGLATSMVTLGSAIGALGVGGAIAKMDQLEETFAGVESRAEAMQAMMQGAMDMFMEALDPLTTGGNIDFFIDMVEWVGRLTNRFAQFFQQIRPLVLDFIGNVSQGTEDIDKLFSALLYGIRVTQPIIEDLFIWLNNSLPDAIRFMTQSAHELSEPMSELGTIFLNMTTSLIDMAGGALPAVVSVLEILLTAIRAVADLFNFLGDGITQFVVAAGAGVFVADKLLTSLDGMSAILSPLGGSFMKVAKAAGRGGLATALGQARSEFAELIGLRYNNLKDIKNNLGNVTEAAGLMKNSVADAANDLMSIDSSRLPNFGQIHENMMNIAGIQFRDDTGQMIMPSGGSFTSTDILADGFTDLLPNRIGNAISKSNSRLRSGMGRMKNIATDTGGDLIASLSATFEDPIGSITNLASSLKTLSIQYLKTAGAALKTAGAWAVAKVQAIGHTIATTAQILATQGAAAAMQYLTSSLYASVAGFVASAASALGLSGVITGGLIPSVGALGTALNVALAGIPLILGAIAVAGAAVVGVIGNMGSITAGAGSIFESLKNTLVTIGNHMLNIWVPTWNIMVGILEMILAPFQALLQFWGELNEALGNSSSEGEGFLSSLLSGFGELTSIIGGFLSKFSGAFNIIATLIKYAVLVPLQASIPVIVWFVDLISDLFEWFMSLSVVEGVISDIMNWFDALGKLIDDIISGAIEKINELIDVANTIPGVSIERIGGSEAGEGLRTTADEVRENLRRDDEDAEDKIGTDSGVNLNFEDNIEQNIDVDADPEDREQMRRTVKDAMNEANSLQRRREGHGG